MEKTVDAMKEAGAKYATGGDKAVDRAKQVGKDADDKMKDTKT